MSTHEMMERCPGCLGQGYDLASYRRAKSYADIEDCATCGGTGEVPVAAEPAPVKVMSPHQMQRALIAAAMAAGAEIGETVTIGRPLELSPRYRGRIG